jgi:acyl carrier protein
LADHGARHLALVARSAPSDDARKQIAELEALGASVHVHACDLSDAEQVNALIESFGDLPPLKGVFHLAVVTGDALLADTTPQQFERVLAGKAIGAWNLYNATRALDLDVCVFFSSIATMIAQPGQGAYAAANAFLDTLARYSRARGYPARSIQWGPWIGGGLSAQAGKQRSVRAYAEQGIRPMPPTFGFALLERALQTDDPVVLAASIDWRQFGAYCGESQLPPTWTELVPETEALSVSSAPNAPADLRAELLAAEPGRARQMVLENFLRDGLARVLKIDAAKIDVQKPVGSFGVDSLMAMEFVRRMSASVGIRLPATAVFNYPTVRALTAEVARRMHIPLTQSAVGDDATAVAMTGSAPDAQTHVTSLLGDDLSDEDALRSLTGSPERTS